jgi:hypothetical protein
MAPAYRKGDTLLVRHSREGEGVTVGDDYLFSQRGKAGQSGGTPVTLANLTKVTGTHWICERYNSKGSRLPRREWPIVYVVVGLYRTSNRVLARKAP